SAREAIDNAVTPAVGIQLEYNPQIASRSVICRAIEHAPAGLYHPAKRQAPIRTAGKMVQDRIVRAICAYFEDRSKVVAAAVLGRPKQHPIAGLYQSCKWTATVSHCCAGELVQVRIAAAIRA